jgi:hypothetical protein
VTIASALIEARRRSLPGLLALATTALALAAPTPAQARVAPLLASVEDGNLNAFSQSGATGGTLSVRSGGAYDGSHAALATYRGGSGNGYARAIENVSWSGTEDVWYGAAYLLPTGYAASVQGGNDVLRWDNWGTYGSDADYGAVELWSDGKARLILGKYTNDPGTVLAGPFTLPEGRWFWMEVHQHFSTGSGAVSDVYIDGARIAHSTAPNNYGRGADRVRWGIVCIDAGRQRKSLSLSFDRASIQLTARGPAKGGHAAKSSPRSSRRPPR